MTDLPTVDRMIAELMEKHGMRQVDIARAVGVTQGAISLLLTGGRKRPLFDTYRRIAELYDRKNAAKEAMDE